MKVLIGKTEDKRTYGKSKRRRELSLSSSSSLSSLPSLSHSLSYHRSTVSYKASSPESAFQWFLFQFIVTSRFLKILQKLLTSSSSSSNSLYLSFNKVFKALFLCKVRAMQLAFLLCTVCRIFPSPLTLCNTSSFLTRSEQMIFSILL
jgi:hypothetical protein